MLFRSGRRGKALLRSKARPGDRICVSGPLGRAALALESRAEKAEAMVERLIDAGQKVHFISEQIAPVNVEPLRKWRALVAEWRKEREND